MTLALIIVSIATTSLRYLMSTADMDAAVGFEPRLRGMSPVCFRCTTTAIYQSTLFLLSSLSSNKVNLL